MVLFYCLNYHAIQVNSCMLFYNFPDNQSTQSLSSMLSRLSRLFHKELPTVERMEEIGQRDDLFERARFIDSISAGGMSYLEILELQDRVGLMSQTQFKEIMIKLTTLCRHRHEQALSKPQKERLDSLFEKNKEKRVENQTKTSIFACLKQLFAHFIPVTIEKQNDEESQILLKHRKRKYNKKYIKSKRH